MSNGLEVFGFLADWEAYCEEGGCEERYPPGGQLSTNPKFGWAKSHTRRTGHTTNVRKTREWRISKKRAQAQSPI